MCCVRLRRKQGIEEKFKDISGFILDKPEALKGKWKEYFGNDNSLYVEIGMGKGNFIKNMANKEKNINFIGIDRVPEILYNASKEGITELANLRLLYIDVAYLESYFEAGDIDRIYLNFSDPWPKNRHAKRRLTSSDLLKKYKLLLKKDGEIHFKTDNLDFFKYSVTQFDIEGFSLRRMTYDLHNSGFEGNVMTEYEMKFASMGCPICRCEAINPNS